MAHAVVNRYSRGSSFLSHYQVLSREGTPTVSRNIWLAPQLGLQNTPIILVVNGLLIPAADRSATSTSGSCPSRPGTGSRWRARTTTSSSGQHHSIIIKLKYYISVIKSFRVLLLHQKRFWKLIVLLQILLHNKGSLFLQIMIRHVAAYLEVLDKSVRSPVWWIS